MKLKGKVALITGGNSGIGLATAKLVAAEGASVAIVGRNASTLLQASSQLGPGALTLQEDITDPASITRVVEATIKRFGKLDVLFVNAGSGTITPIASTTLETFESVLRTNVTSPFLLVQAAAPYLKKGSSIIFNGSISSMVGRPSTAAYAASKGALRSMARVIASELSPAGIRVNVISPGSIRTPMLSHVAASGPQQEALVNSMGESIPLERMGDAEEVTKAVLFLASSDSSFIHAAEIIVDGGMTGAPMGAPVYRTTARETSAKPDPHSTPAAG